MSNCCLSRNSPADSFACWCISELFQPKLTCRKFCLPVHQSVVWAKTHLQTVLPAGASVSCFSQNSPAHSFACQYISQLFELKLTCRQFCLPVDQSVVWAKTHLHTVLPAGTSVSCFSQNSLADSFAFHGASVGCLRKNSPEDIIACWCISQLSEPKLTCRQFCLLVHQSVLCEKKNNVS